MNALAAGLAVACAACVAVLLVGHVRDSRATIAAAKTAASLAFVGVALAAGATSSAYGILVLVALLLSLAGDVALLARGAGRAFMVGMAAFASAHLAYAFAFATLGVSRAWMLAGAGVAALAAAFMLAVLARSASGTMRIALVGYALVISVMASLATGAFGAGAAWLVPAGAWAFLASDLFVARHRFAKATPANKLLGLPLYYAAQIALAASVAYLP